MNASASTRRVPAHTAQVVNQKIWQVTVCRIKYYAEHPNEIKTRLNELDEEWDVERVLEANASALALSSLILGITAKKKKTIILSGAVMGFLCQHAIQGWCPPLPILRHMGFRTRTEIEQERYALKVLRGDFADLTNSDVNNIEEVLKRIRT
jgi:hypothetical protein